MTRLEGESTRVFSLCGTKLDDLRVGQSGGMPLSKILCPSEMCGFQVDDAQLTYI